MTVEKMKHHLPESAQAYYIEESAIQDAEIPPAIESAAHILVSERHGKFDLAHLVGYLLTELSAHEASNRIKTENLETLRARVAELEAILRDSITAFDEIDGAFEVDRDLCQLSANAARAALGESDGSNPV